MVRMTMLLLNTKWHNILQRGVTAVWMGVYQWGDGSAVTLKRCGTLGDNMGRDAAI